MTPQADALNFREFLFAALLKHTPGWADLDIGSGDFREFLFAALLKREDEHATDTARQISANFYSRLY